MINLKRSKKNWEASKLMKARLDRQDYKKHFQLAIINLEQNMIEERMPDLRMYA